MYEDQAHPEGVGVVLPDHIQQGIYAQAPPSYEEVMGAKTQTSLQPSITDLPPIAYIDIMPRCLNPGNMKEEISPQYDPFSTVIQTANKWLVDHSRYAVWKCETVERRVQATGETDLNLMCTHQSTYGFNVHVSGIRMWLTLRMRQTQPQQIGLMNFLPHNVNVQDERYSAYYGKRGRQNVPTVFMHSYGGVNNSIERLNIMLKSKPLPGTIINIDMCPIVATEGFMESDLNPEKTYRCESGSSFWRRYTQVFRVFYLKGPPTSEEIGTEVFTPAVLSRPKQAKRATYQTFSEVLRSASLWLREQSGIRVVNILSRNVKAEESSFSREAKVFPDCTDTFDMSMGTGRIQVRAIRIFYVKVPKGGDVPFYNINLSSKLFPPARIGKQFETMSQTMFRIEAWLRITGLQVLSVETVEYLLKVSSPDGLDDQNVNTVTKHHDSKDWVTALRLYFATEFHEPPAHLLPAQPKGSQKGSSSCIIL